MSIHRLAIEILVLMILACGGISASAETLDIKTGSMVEGSPTTITVKDSRGIPVAGVILDVTFRPGSKVQLQKEIGTTDKDGTLSWTPSIAGLVKISVQQKEAATGEERPAHTGETTAAVRYASVAGRSVLVLLVAGFILFGGIIWSYCQLQKPLPEEESPPSD